MPIMGNIGNILYVLIAFIGGILIIAKAPNLSPFGSGDFGGGGGAVP